MTRVPNDAPIMLHGVSYRIGNRMLVDGVTQSFAAGQVNVLIGPNGAGKTMLLKLLAGIIQPYAGRIMFSGRAVQAGQAGQIAYLPQFHQSAWPLAARDVVALGLLPEGGMAVLNAETRIMAALARCGAQAFADKPITALSGGERARVMLARLLVSKARFLLLDEPVQSLDPRGALDLLDILRDEARRGRGIIVVLHDVNLARRFGDHALLMQQGRIVASGGVADIFTPAQLQAIFATEFDAVGDYLFPTIGETSKHDTH